MPPLSCLPEGTFGKCVSKDQLHPTFGGSFSSPESHELECFILMETPTQGIAETGDCGFERIEGDRPDYIQDERQSLDPSRHELSEPSKSRGVGEGMPSRIFKEQRRDSWPNKGTVDSTPAWPGPSQAAKPSLAFDNEEAAAVPTSRR